MFVTLYVREHLLQPCPTDLKMAQEEKGSPRDKSTAEPSGLGAPEGVYNMEVDYLRDVGRGLLYFSQKHIFVKDFLCVYDTRADL